MEKISDERLKDLEQELLAMGAFVQLSNSAYANKNAQTLFDSSKGIQELLSARQTILDLEEAWQIDETIQADGSLRPSISKTIERYEQTIRDKDALIEELKADGERLAGVLTEATRTWTSYRQYQCDLCGEVEEDGHAGDCSIGNVLDQHNALMKKLEDAEMDATMERVVDENIGAWRKLAEE